MDGRDSVSRTTWLARNLNRSVVSQSFFIWLFIFCISSSDRRIPLWFYYVALVCRTPGLELRLQFHEQHHVRRALCNLTRAFPDKGSWDGERPCGSRKSYLWDHGADYRPIREFGDIGSYLRFSLPLYRVGFYCVAVAVRAAGEGVIVDTQQNAAFSVVNTVRRL